MAIQHSKTPPNFRRLRIKKTGDKSRIVFEPTKQARIIHDYHMIHFPDLQMKGPLQTMQRHIDSGNRFYLKMDLYSAFDFVTLEHVWQQLPELGVDCGLLQKDSKYFFHHPDDYGGLIQGAPASPYIFESFCRSGLDYGLQAFEKMQNRLLKRNYVITRYADDVLLSSRERIGRTVSPEIAKIMYRYGFVPNHSKIVRCDTHITPLNVLGITISKGKAKVQEKITTKLLDGQISDASRKGVYAWKQAVESLNTDKSPSA